jgi:hypothetical protein
LVELLAVRLFELLNGGGDPGKDGEGNTSTLNWRHESCLVSFLRDTAPGFRASLTLVGVYMLVLELWFDKFIFFKHAAYIDRWSMQPGNAVVTLFLLLWVFDIALVQLCFYLLNVGRGDLRLSVYSTKAERERERDQLWCMRALRRTAWVLYAVFFGATFVLQSFVAHTILAQVYVRQNVYYTALLGVTVGITLLTGLSDLCAIGTPWGVGESSRAASALLSFRAIVSVPLVAWWAVTTVFASYPPSFCEEC